MWEGVGKKKGSEGKEGWNGRVIGDTFWIDFVYKSWGTQKSLNVKEKEYCTENRTQISQWYGISHDRSIKESIDSSIWHFVATFISYFHKRIYGSTYNNWTNRNYKCWGFSLKLYSILKNILWNFLFKVFLFVVFDDLINIFIYLKWHSLENHIINWWQRNLCE